MKGVHRTDLVPEVKTQTIGQWWIEEATKPDSPGTRNVLRMRMHNKELWRVRKELGLVEEGTTTLIITVRVVIELIVMRMSTQVPNLTTQI